MSEPLTPIPHFTRAQAATLRRFVALADAKRDEERLRLRIEVMCAADAAYAWLTREWPYYSVTTRWRDARAALRAFEGGE